MTAITGTLQGYLTLIMKTRGLMRVKNYTFRGFVSVLLTFAAGFSMAQTQYCSSRSYRPFYF
jgi:hypothetical protein